MTPPPDPTPAAPSRAPSAPSAFARLRRGVASGVLGLAMAGLCAHGALLASAYLGRLGGAALGAAVAAAIVRRRPVPGLGAVRWVTARLARWPIVTRPGIEALWAALAALELVALAILAPALHRGSVRAEGFVIEDLARGWKSTQVRWSAAQTRVIAVHGSGAEQHGFTLVDASGDPPVGRFRPAPWPDDVASLTVLSGRGLLLAHTMDSRRAFVIDEEALAAHELRDDVNGVTATGYDAASRRVFLARRADSDGGPGSSGTEVLAVGVDDYLRGELAGARRYPVAAISGATEIHVDAAAPERLYLRGGTWSRAIVELDLGSGASRTVDVPTGVSGLAIDARHGRAYVTNGVRGSVLAIDLERFAVERETWVSGLPGPIAALPAVRGVAVGTRAGGELVVLDEADLGLRARLLTCAERDPLVRLGEAILMGKARDLDWDDRGRSVFFADGCGVRRIRFPEGWCASRSCDGATRRAS